MDPKNELWNATNGGAQGRMPSPDPMAGVPHPHGLPFEGGSGQAEQNDEHRNSARAAPYRALIAIATSTSAIPTNTCGGQ